MAKQSGPIKYNGTIGDIRHFKIKGQRGHFAGMKGGPSGDQVKTGAEFARTRENMSEFAACAKAGKSIRIALSSILGHTSDRQLTGRLTALMKKINLEDGSEARGRRAIELTNAPQYLVGLNFNVGLSFDTAFRGEYTLEPDASRKSSKLVLPAFSPGNVVRKPTGTTHFRFIHALAAVSNYSFNDETGAYEPDEPNFHEIAAISYSEFIPAATGEVLPLNVETFFDVQEAVPGDVAMLDCIGIEFYQKVGAGFYLLNAGNCLKIEAVL